MGIPARLRVNEMTRMFVADHASRRVFLQLAGAAASVRECFGQSTLRIGIMDLVLRKAGKPEALSLAKQLGLEAVQVTIGKSSEGKPLPLEDPGIQKAYRDSAKRTQIPIDSTYLDMLHQSCLKNDPAAREWVAKGIEITKKLNAGILMTVFFGKCAVPSRQELDYVIDKFRDLVTEAERANIIIGFENTLSGEDNRYAVDRISSKAFKVWYDVGNSTFNGYDVPAEIRMLGRDRICQFHFKDKGYLGEGKVQFIPILQAIRDIQYSGYANLETVSPSGSVMEDAKRNLDYLRQNIIG
jgi:L-ribulose-5-phosphate 3-epimerase